MIRSMYSRLLKQTLATGCLAASCLLVVAQPVLAAALPPTATSDSKAQNNTPSSTNTTTPTPPSTNTRTPTPQAATNAPSASTNSSAADTQVANDANNTALGPSFNSSVSALTQEQRLARLEQQVTNLINSGQAQKVTSLQEQMQALMGQLEVVQHDLKQLNQQQRGFYQDLDQRINHLQTLTSGNTAAGASSGTQHTAPKSDH